MGSSPRVRGKLPRGRNSIRKPGLIPACAGKTHAAPRHRCSPRAHPRVCGENRFNTDALLRDDGSSPRVRGKLLELGAEDDREGLIPACAGKTSWKSSTPWPWWAHPRVCGENEYIDRCGHCVSGSSPRVRGKLPRPDRRVRSHGLIPACAGKTPPPPGAACRRRAHPRVCGENDRMIMDLGDPGGSSPRVRGKPPAP